MGVSLRACPSRFLILGAWISQPQRKFVNHTPEGLDKPSWQLGIFLANCSEFTFAELCVSCMSGCLLGDSLNIA